MSSQSSTSSQQTAGKEFTVMCQKSKNVAVAKHLYVVAKFEIPYYWVFQVVSERV